MLSVRRASRADLEAMEAVYAAARAYMRRSGNPTQWGDTAPARPLLLRDIRRGEGYVLCDETGRICATFALCLGPEPTYQVIEQGAWKNELPYGTIHRLGGNGSRQGVFSCCLDFCRGVIPNLRADTHRNNRTMRHLLEKSGFRYCGIIHVADGSERLAYQLEAAAR